MAEKQTETIGKIEAVRKAVEALGAEAERDRIQTFIKDNFGIDMPAKHISDYKAKVVRRLKEKEGQPQQTEKKEPTAQPQETAQEKTTPQASSSSEGGSISKMEAIRQAMDALGTKAERGKLKSFIQERFGLELSPKYISDSKAKILSRSKKKTPKAKPAMKEPAAKESTPTKAPTPSNGKSSILVSDILEVKKLVERVGADQLRVLVDALSK